MSPRYGQPLQRACAGAGVPAYARLMASDVATCQVTVSAGTLRASPDGECCVSMPHRWTSGGVVIAAPFTGAHMLHVAVAGCVLNDVYREAEGFGVVVDGVVVTAWGGFDHTTWRSTGINYHLDVASSADHGLVDELLRRVHDVAEIPAALRHGTTVVHRTDLPD